MGGDHRARRRGEHVAERRVRDVGDVHQHAELVHPPHHPPAEVGEPTLAPRVHGRTRPVVPVVPGERHVAHAEAVQRVEVLEGILDRMPSFDPQERGHVPPRRGGTHLARVGRELHVGIGVHEPAHGPDQIERPPERRAGPVARIHPDGEERRREAALLHPRDIHVPVGEPDRDVRSHVEHPLRGVDVAVYEQQS